MKNKKIRILYICDITGWGGSTLSLKNLIEALPADGYILNFLIKSKGPVYDEIHKKGYNCIVFPYSNYSICYGLNPKQLARFLIEYVKYFLINPLCVWYVSNKLLNQIDIVHSNTSSITFGQNIAKRLNAKHIWHVREFLDMFDSSILIKGRSYLYNKLQCSDATISITRPVAKHWDLLDNNRSYIIHDAVRHKDDICYKIIKEKYFVFCCGYLNDFKGTDFAVEAFCKSGFPKIGYKLFLVGGYSRSYRDKLQKIACLYNADDYIIYTGFLLEEKYRDLLSKASAYLQCSKIEGLGRTVIEAMFYGCPVIARNNGGTLDIIEDNKTGFLFNTLEECIAKMNDVTTEDVGTIILEAQKEAVERFSIEDYGRKVGVVYKEMMNYTNEKI